MKRLFTLSLFFLFLSYIGISQELNVAANHTKIQPVEKGKKVILEGELKDIEGKTVKFSDIEVI